MNGQIGSVVTTEAEGRTALLGLAWSLVTLLALLAGPLLLAAWLGLNAAVAAAEASRTWKHMRGRPTPQVVAAVVAAVVVAAGVGPVEGAIALVAGAVVILVRTKNDARALVCASLPAMAVAGPLLLRAADGLVAALVLLVYAGVYDAASFVMGGGARFRWEGPVAGIACIGTVTVAVAAIFPQFKGAAPWELGGLAAVLAPIGPVVAERFVVNRAVVNPRARIPAVKRLDSLMVLGPVWAIAAAALVS